VVNNRLLYQGFLQLSRVVVAVPKVAVLTVVFPVANAQKIVACINALVLIWVQVVVAGLNVLLALGVLDCGNQKNAPSAS
jgi:hypothetical protein